MPASDTAPAKPRLGRDVYVLGGVAFFVMLGFGVVIPVLPVYVRSFGVGYFELGMVVSVFALMRLVSSSFAGWLADRLGERVILTAGVLIVAASSALTGLAQSYFELLAWRGLGGIGSAMFSISAMALLLRTTSPRIRGRAVGFYQGGFLIGGMAGPAVGGLLAGISLRAPFFFYAGTLVLAALVAVALLSRGGADARRAHTSGGGIPFREVFADRRYRAALIANFAVGWSNFGVRSALVPVFVVEVLHRSELWTGIAIAVAAIAQALMLAPATKFVDTVGRRPAIIGAFTVGGAAMLAVPFAADIWVLIAILSIYGAAAAFMGTAPAAAVGDAAGGRTGQPVAVFSAVSDVASIIAPLVAGLLVDVLSYTAGFATAFVMLAIASAYAFLRMPRHFGT